MKSVFNQFLIALQNKIGAEIPDSEIEPGIRETNQDLGQLEVYDVRPAVPFPCLLVDLAAPSYEQKQFKTQWANMQVTMRLGFDQWGSSSSLSPEDVRVKALAYYEIENKIYEVLQDWNAEGLLMRPLRRLSAVTEKRDDKFRVRVITFTAVYEDRVRQAL